MDFIEFSVRVKEPAEMNAEIVVALLGEYPFDTFDVQQDTVRAYAVQGAMNESLLAEAAESVADFIASEPEINIIPKQNWNEEWEKNFFEPITVNDRVHIRAPFHAPMPNAEIEIVIEPRMSFGTGHHETTQGMVQGLLEIESTCPGAKVMDMGAGTGVLAIVAQKLGAVELTAVDIEEWAVENALDNFRENKCSNYEAFQSDVNYLETIPDNTYDIFLANIQRSVILADLSAYAQKTKTGGFILLSGFFTTDAPAILAEANKFQLKLFKEIALENWATIVLQKNA